MQCDEFPLPFSCGTISMHILRTTYIFNKIIPHAMWWVVLPSPSPSSLLSLLQPSSVLSPLSLSLLYPAPSPLPPSSSPLLFLQILCYLFRTCKWRSTTPETLRRLTCTSEGRRWQRWWALLPLSSRRMDTESLACSSNVDSTTISLTPLTSLVSRVISCDVMWSHVMACDLMWCHVMSCDLVMACDFMWCHVMAWISWCRMSCDLMWWHVISCDLVISWCHNLNMKVAKPYTIHWIFLVKKVSYMWIWKYNINDVHVFMFNTLEIL